MEQRGLRGGRHPGTAKIELNTAFTDSDQLQIDIFGAPREPPAARPVVGVIEGLVLHAGRGSTHRSEQRAEGFEPGREAQRVLAQPGYVAVPANGERGGQRVVLLSLPDPCGPGPRNRAKVDVRSRLEVACHGPCLGRLAEPTMSPRFVLCAPRPRRVDTAARTTNRCPIRGPGPSWISIPR